MRHRKIKFLKRVQTVRLQFVVLLSVYCSSNLAKMLVFTDNPVRELDCIFHDSAAGKPETSTGGNVTFADVCKYVCK